MHIHSKEFKAYFPHQTCNSSSFFIRINEYDLLNLNIFLKITELSQIIVFETHSRYLQTSCLYSISHLLSITIHVSNLLLTKTLRICLYTGVLPESRFALQCFLVFEITYHAYIFLCIHDLSYRILRFISLTYVTYLDDYTNLLTLLSSSKTFLT